MKYLCHCNLCRCAGDTQGLAVASRWRVMACQQAVEVAEPSVGAHLVTPRRGYTHHGIYAGEGRVLHYAGLARNFQSGPVEEVSLEYFANGRAVYIECRETQALEAQEIVMRARSRIGESKYRLLTNNCEHFTEWSRFGTDRSRQVERWFGRSPAMARAIVNRIGRQVERLRPMDRASAAA